MDWGRSCSAFHHCWCCFVMWKQIHWDFKALRGWSHMSLFSVPLCWPWLFRLPSAVPFAPGTAGPAISSSLQNNYLSILERHVCPSFIWSQQAVSSRHDSAGGKMRYYGYSLQPRLGSDADFGFFIVSLLFVCGLVLWVTYWVRWTAIKLRNLQRMLIIRYFTIMQSLHCADARYGKTQHG